MTLSGGISLVMSRAQDRFQTRRRQIAGLEALCIEGSADGPTVVIFHGFGADMNDLVSLASVLAAPEGTNWIFPNGHLTVPLGGHYAGRAWFPISIAELERSMSRGEPIDWSTLVPPGLDTAQAHVMDLIEELQVPTEKLLLGGFSQGAMLATEVMLHLDQPPAGLAILSGTLINGSAWKTLAEKHKGYSFFQSHGASDPVLSFAMAQRLERLFIEAGWKGQLLKFNGGHEIPQQVISQLSGYIRRKLA